MVQIIVWRYADDTAKAAILEAIAKVEEADAQQGDSDTRVHVAVPVTADVEVLPEIYRVAPV